MKRIVSILTAAIVATTLMTATAFAGSHGGRHHEWNISGSAAAVGSSKTRTAVCNLEGCALTGQHTHDGTTYYAHYYGDGHTYHEYCNAENCSVAGYHEHSGIYCFGSGANDGYSYHSGGSHH